MGKKRKVIGIGETILDILFKDKRPVAAVPGGSCFNTIISVGRAGIPCSFAGYSAQDAVGRQTRDFLQENGVGTEAFELRHGEKSSISLAYLDHNGDADYVFYKLTPRLPADWKAPVIGRDDILIISSYFAICQGTRAGIRQLLHQASLSDTIVYYDLNFRQSHLHELESLMPAIHENFRLSGIVRGSADDFQIMYGTRDPMEIYQRHIAAHCPTFICTAGAGDVSVCTAGGCLTFPTPKTENIVSTIGAGDNFNAGLVYGLIRDGIKKGDIARMAGAQWQRVISAANAFAADACQTTDNYIGKQFASRLKEIGTNN